MTVNYFAKGSITSSAAKRLITFKPVPLLPIIQHEKSNVKAHIYLKTEIFL